MNAGYFSGMYEPPPRPAPVRELSPLGDGVFGDLAPRHRPLVSRGLIVLCGLVFAAQQLDGNLIERFAVGSDQILRGGEWWRLITGAFIHANLIHFAMNAWFGWSVGMIVERFVGPARMFIVSLAAMLASSGLVAFMGQNSVGFSGVLYGWLGAWLAFHFTPRFPGLRLSGAGFRSFMTTLGLNVVISLAPGISFLGHLGGFVGGFAVAFLLGLGRPRAS